MATLDVSSTSIAEQELNMKRFRRLILVGFGQGDLAVVDELFAPDFVEHQEGVRPPNAEGVKGIIAYLRQALPDLNYTIEDIAASDDRVWGRLRSRGTHRGPFMGIPPTGNEIAITVIDICRFVNGKIVEHWGVPDQLSLLRQIGASVQPPQTPA
jgi:predicted ester cyclase